MSGWNNIITGATYKTVGLTGAWTVGKITWINTYYGGPDGTVNDRGERNLYDTVVQLTPSSKTSIYVDFDYLHDSPEFARAVQTYGIAAAGKLQGE